MPWTRIVVRIVGAIAFYALLLLVPAGRPGWPEAWIFLGLYLVYVSVVASWLRRHDPELLAERMTLWKRSGRGWDKAIIVASSVALVALLVLAGLDERWGWSRVPLALEAAAFILVVLSLGVVFLTFRENTFLSRFVEIQRARGHRVITTGPYRVVRHPMYAAFLVHMLAIPVALGSWVALVPAFAIVVLMIARTAKEDRALHAELPGYPEYAQRTRYRLVPGIW